MPGLTECFALALGALAVALESIRRNRRLARRLSESR